MKQPVSYLHNNELTKGTKEGGLLYFSFLLLVLLLLVTAFVNVPHLFVIIP